MKNLPMTISTTHCKLKGFETRSFSLKLREMNGEDGTGFILGNNLYKEYNRSANRSFQQTFIKILKENTNFILQ